MVKIGENFATIVCFWKRSDVFQQTAEAEGKATNKSPKVAANFRLVHRWLSKAPLGSICGHAIQSHFIKYRISLGKKCLKKADVKFFKKNCEILRLGVTSPCYGSKVPRYSSDVLKFAEHWHGRRQ